MFQNPISMLHPPLHHNRLFWIDTAFFYAFLLLLFLPYQILVAYLGLAFIYPVAFVIIARRIQKEPSDIGLHLIRIPFIWLAAFSFLSHINLWSGTSNLYGLMYFTAPIFFLIFMLMELKKRTGLGRWASIPISLGISLLLVGIIFVQQSYPNGREMYWTGFSLIIVGMLVSLWRFFQKEDYCLAYLALGGFFLLYVLIRNPLRGVSAELINAFFKL